MVSSLASMERWPRRPSSAGPPPSPVHGASKAMLIDGRPGSPSDLCSTDSHVLRRKCGARYKMCSTAQPAPTVLEGSTCHSSYEGPRSGSSRSDHTGNPGVASVTEDPPSIRCEHATPEDACRLARRQTDSAHLACGRTRSGESGRQSVYNTGQIHARARMRRASPCSSRQMLDQSGHGAARNSQSTASFSRRFLRLLRLPLRSS